METRTQPHEISLDPEDWEALRELGYRMVDAMLDDQRTVRDRPIWHPIPDDTLERLNEPPPEDPIGEEAAFEDFLRDVQPNPMGNTHPRFWGWVIGTGIPFGALAEMLAAGMNPNTGGGDHGAMHVEKQVLDWAKTLLGFPAESSGLLTSGGSMANLVGLTVARNTLAGYDIRAEGVGAAPQPLTMYASEETHSSNIKAADLLGLGQDALRLIPVDEDYAIRLDALEEAIAADRAAGRKPIAIIGHAGTVKTGAFDDLTALANICQREGMWFHVDGAFGALAALAPEVEHLTEGMARADSVAFDMHKWLYMPIEVGCTLVRHPRPHLEAFTLTPDYLTHGTRGLTGGSLWYSDYGVQLSRGFRALKVWMALKAYGVSTFRRLIAQNVEQAQYLAALVDAHPALERLAPAPLNIVCFRYADGGLSDEALDAINAEIVLRLHEQGLAVPSYATIDGRYAIRTAITNHRSRREDFDALVEDVVRLGGEIAREQAA